MDWNALSVLSEKLCMYVPRMLQQMPSLSIRAVVAVMLALPVLLCCILLNRYIFKSADMIGGAING